MPIGGKLRLKGDKKKKEKVSGKRSLEESGSGATEAENGGSEQKKIIPPQSIETIDTSSILTETQKRHMAKKIKLESTINAELVKTTYRNRVENFNNKLSSLSEHNDIPRVSAAGNG